MKKKQLLIVAVLTSIIASCSTDIEPALTNEQSVNDYSLSLEESLSRVLPLLTEAEGQPTRSAERKIKSSETITLSGTRSSVLGGDEYYLVNFDNNQGFAIVAADKRAIPVLGFSPEGQFSYEEAVSNPNFNYYLEQFSELNQDVVNNEIYPMDPPIDWSKFTMSHVIFPLIPKSNRCINQTGTFSTYCKGSHAGCVPVAMATYMSYFKQPSSYKSYKFNWDEMTTADNRVDSILCQEGKLGIARLLSLLGQPENLNVSIDGGVYQWELDDLIKRTFKNFGYQEGVLEYFTSDRGMKALRKKCPILINGLGRSSMTGHSWVIDGAMIKKYSPVLNLPSEYFFHCIWGWGGFQNGYYNFTQFRFPEGDGFEPTELMTHQMNGYQGLHMMYDFKP